MLSSDKSTVARLKAAVTKGDVVATARLLKGGVDVNASYWYENNLLHEAVACGYSKIVKLLINANADVNARNQDGRMPLHIACRNGNEEIVAMLLKAEARVNAQTKDGKTCLNTSLWRGHASVASMLIFKGANVNLADQDGWTALHWAAKTNLVPCIETLIAVGANLNARDKFNRTPLHEALGTGNPKLVTSLLMHGADPDVCPKMKGTSTLMLLLKSKEHNQELVFLLLSSGYALHLDEAFRNHVARNLNVVSFVNNEQLNSLLLQSMNAIPALLHLCRSCVRRHISRCHAGRSILRKIDLLPLPESVRHYLALKEELS